MWTTIHNASNIHAGALRENKKMEKREREREKKTENPFFVPSLRMYLVVLRSFTISFVLPLKSLYLFLIRIQYTRILFQSKHKPIIALLLKDFHLRIR